MKKFITFIVVALFINTTTIKAQEKISGAIKLWNNKTPISNKTYGKYYTVNINADEINKIYFSQTQHFKLLVNYESENLIIDLNEIPQNEIKIKKNNAEYCSGLNIPRMFNGKLVGEKMNNNCMLTISKDYLSAQLIFPTYSIEVAKNNNNPEEEYILFNSKDFHNPAPAAITCGMPIPKIENKLHEQTVNKLGAGAADYHDKCTYVFIDCTDSLYKHFISAADPTPLQTTVNYVLSIWNDVHTAYTNEQLNVGISEINIWTTTTPFNITNRTNGIQTFSAYYQNNFQGNMAMLLDWSTTVNGRAGVAGGFGKAKDRFPNVCGTYTPNTNATDVLVGSYIYNDLNYFGNYSNFPNTSIQKQVYSCVHELGHLFGSHHTHWCGWSGGAIDNCSAQEGSCDPGPNQPSTGGTFMSYCIGDGEFVNFNNGFGQQPGDVLRFFVTFNSCIGNCNCNLNWSVGAITQEGFYHFEASNEVSVNGEVPTNNTLIKLDGGARVKLEPGFKALLGSKVNAYIDGCNGIR